MRRAVLLLSLAFLALAPAAHAGGPSMLVGAAEDAVRQPTLVAAKAKLEQLRLAGFTAVRLSEVWTTGKQAPPADELKVLSNVVGAANILGMQSFIAVFPSGSKVTPLTDQDRSDFAKFTAAVATGVPGVGNIIVGNEPNLNRFWLPQFNADGSDAAAPAYEALLAQTYDAIKAVSPSTLVLGGAVSPRGGDKPGTGRDTHSPTVFIADMGAAYRASGRPTPIMDELDIHPYEDTSSVPPTFAHPKTSTISIADYDKLVALLGKAFDGTAQPGSTLPIVYGEFGVESLIPADKANLYSGAEPATTKPVDEKTQGEYYRQAIALSFCQPNVRGIMILHAFDEATLPAWQSGVYYANGTAKSSLPVVQKAVRDSKGGIVARCPGLELVPRATAVYPHAAAFANPPLKVNVTCSIDCNVYARLERLPSHATTLVATGQALAGTKTPIAFAPTRVAPGRYRFTVRVTAPVNTGPPGLITSGAILVH